MKFTGQIRVPEIDHPGVPATFVIEGSQAEVILEGDESLGRWSLYDVHARRLVSSAFQVDLDGEEITFVADEPIDFAYRGVEHMAEVWAKFRSMNVARRMIAVSRSRSGTEPSRVEAFRSAIEENLEAQSEKSRLAGSITSSALDAEDFTPESVAREVEALPPAVESAPEEDTKETRMPLAGEPSMSPPSVPKADSQVPRVGEHAAEEPKEVASPSEQERLAEERRAIEEERARLEEQRSELEDKQAEAEQREADRVEAFRLEMKRLEAERAEYERLEKERQDALRQAMERLEAERGEVERKGAEQQQQHEQEDARRAAALHEKLNALEEERLRREREEKERVAAARARMEQLEEQRREIESLERVREAEAAEHVVEEATAAEEATPAHEAMAPSQDEQVASAEPEPAAPDANVVDLDELEEPPSPPGLESEVPEEPEPEVPEEPEPVPASSDGSRPQPVLATTNDDRQGGIMGAVRAAFGRGSNGHTHEFVEAPGGLGITRSICRECGHVSISTGD